MCPCKELGQMLSVDTPTTTSSFNEQNKNPSEKFRLIGFGACGAIYAQDGSPIVYKLAKTTDDQLWNDYIMHTRVWEAFNKTPYIAAETCVPEPGGFVPRDGEGEGGQEAESPWWTRSSGQRLTTAVGDNLNMPTRTLWSEKIFPLPLPLRTALTTSFCAPQNQSSALASPGNADCLVRIYLGSRNGRPGGRFFSLRNYKLYLNQMEQMGMQVEIRRLARYMAGALAVMHWRARVDARDVEFVLGSSRPRPQLVRAVPPEPAAELEKLPANSRAQADAEATVSSEEQHTIAPQQLAFWLLDFNQCGDMPMNAEGVARAVDDFWMNDPYYPRPPRSGQHGEEGHEVNPHFLEDQALWRLFADRYLEVSRKILMELDEPQWALLPLAFVHGVERLAARRN